MDLVIFVEEITRGYEVVLLFILYKSIYLLVKINN